MCALKQGVCNMTFVLTGVCQGMRVVGNKADQEHAAGEKWRFLSLEIVDTGRSGVHSCQVSDRSTLWNEFVGTGPKYELLKDYTDHKVKAVVGALQPAIVTVKDENGNDTGDTKAIVRIRLTRLTDLGLDDDE